MKYAYGTTWDDFALTPHETAWHMIRALRHNPPGLAEGDPNRGLLFTAAMEQSEQLFRAAATTGPETCPLLLFYGLSQSGRAVRAANDPQENWARAKGHGLTVKGESVGTRLSTTIISDQKTGLFRDVARTLNRASLLKEENVGDLARLGRLGTRFPLDGSEPSHPPLELELQPPSALRDFLENVVDHEWPLRANLSVPAETWARELPPVGIRETSHYDEYRSHVRNQLGRYPTLNDAQLVDDVPGHFDLGGAGPQRTVVLEWPDRARPRVGAEYGALHAFSDDTGHRVVVYPAGRGSNLAVHPYLLWWAVLYAMAHYVRYEPTHWAAIVDVDHSDEAVAVEHLCDRALDVLPELIHRTLVRGAGDVVEPAPCPSDQAESRTP